MLRFIEDDIKMQNPGQDTITLQESLIDALAINLNLEKVEVQRLKELIRTEYVPVVTKEKVDEALKSVEVHIISLDSTKGIYDQNS